MKKRLLVAITVAGVSFALLGHSGASIIVVPPGPAWEQITGTPFEVPSDGNLEDPGISGEPLSRKTFLARHDDTLLFREDPWIRIAFGAGVYDLSTVPLSLGGAEELKLYSRGSVVFDDRAGGDTLVIPRPIPEVSTALLIGCGFLGLYGLRRKMRRK